VTLPQEAIEGMKLEGRDSILFTCDQSPVFVAKKLWLPYGCMCCGSEKELQTIPNRYRKIVLCRACCEAVKSYHETGVD
ncbi:MAG: hypothetical protein LIO58_09735, partial [Oscillospiraceae bacterium]|nr:hypothetical protein [Oscillospiraceae bacterium]